MIRRRWKPLEMMKCGSRILAKNTITKSEDRKEHQSSLATRNFQKKMHSNFKSFSTKKTKKGMKKLTISPKF